MPGDMATLTTILYCLLILSLVTVSGSTEIRKSSSHHHFVSSRLDTYVDHAGRLQSGLVDQLEERIRRQLHAAEYGSRETGVQRRETLEAVRMRRKLAQLSPTESSEVELQALWGENNVVKSDGSYSLTYTNKDGGVLLRSTKTYREGDFSVDIQFPAGDSSVGLDVAFMLSSDFGSSSQNAIILELKGDTPTRAHVGLLKDGDIRRWIAADLDFSVAWGPASYSISWSANQILWSINGDTIRVLNSSTGEPWFPDGTLLYLYVSVNNTASIVPPSWRTEVPTSGPLVTKMSKVKVSSPKASWTASAVTSPKLIPHLGFDYCEANMESGPGSTSVTFYSSGCGGRWHSGVPYQYGDFSTKFKCAPGNTSGLVSTFYLSSNADEGKQDEVDLEWLGRDKSLLQTNYYVQGNGNHEEFHHLTFDCSLDYHEYTIKYSPVRLQWLVDGTPIRTVLASNVSEFPHKPAYLYGSLWNGSNIANGWWAGRWDHDADGPWTVNYQSLTVGPPS